MPSTQTKSYSLPNTNFTKLSCTTRHLFRDTFERDWGPVLENVHYVQSIDQVQLADWRKWTTETLMRGRCVAFVGLMVMIKSRRACNILAGNMSLFDGVCGPSCRELYFVDILRFIKSMWMKQLFVKFNFKIMNYDHIFVSCLFVSSEF